MEKEGRKESLFSITEQQITTSFNGLNQNLFYCIVLYVYKSMWVSLVSPLSISQG
jgi:hypothetical protein